MIDFVQAAPAHIALIQQLAMQVWPHTFAPILSPLQINYMMDMMYSSESLQRQMTQQHHHYLLPRDESGYLGYVSYELSYQGSPYTKVHKIYVLPSAQGKGVGRACIDKVAAIAAAQANRGLQLNVNRSNPAVQFYQCMGFEVVATEDIDIGNGFLMEDYVMRMQWHTHC